MSLLVRQVMRAPVIGLASGLVVALVLTQPLRLFLGVVRPLDPTTFGVASLVLAAVIAVATWIPARRAGRMDPAQILRRE
jgi:ABC-type antimicrobial peptide transport system permease subunit